jgi:hypothetical protein
MSKIALALGSRVHLSLAPKRAPSNGRATLVPATRRCGRQREFVAADSPSRAGHSDFIASDKPTKPRSSKH